MRRGAPARPIVVGIGASAGGLEAFKRFFRNMPADSGLAFVLIQHLDPTHESLTAELIARCTPMPAVQVERDTAVARDHIYVIPPNRYLRIEDGALRLSTPSEPRGLRMPIDVFLRSLSTDQQEKAIGIVMSGTGTDGTLGLKEIKAFGGMVVVQDPTTAEYDGMPRSAIAIAGVDYVLPPEKMPQALIQYVRHSYVQGTGPQPLGEERAGELNSIVALLRTRVKFDFTPYRRGTLMRRIQRRMSLAHVESIADYVSRLRADDAEVTALFKDLLISVTSFFRDPKAWQLLDQEVLPPLVAAKAPGAPLRVWVAGCATGEEAYSMAMLLIEQLHVAQKSVGIQIFATDVDTDALEFARAGVYPESIAVDVSPHRLRRFFTQAEHSYRVSKELREVVTFAEQNLITDPPFSRLDLISCRNLLIYLEPAIQKKIVSLLHFALGARGYLFLGSAESSGQQDDLFETVSKKWRIYRRVGPTRHDKVQFPVASFPEVDHKSELPRAAPVLPDLNRLARLAQQHLLERYAPASVIINRKCEALFFCGRTEDYLTQPPGLPTHDLVATAREGLQTALRGAVHKALHENQAVAVNARVKRRQGFHHVKVTIEPLKVAKEMEGLLLVSFQDELEEGAAPAIASHPPPVHSAVDDALVPQLEYELKTTREDLQSTIEELETSNEELKAANEEVMSVNEELQSTNEELETSKEELQSLNEELTTVNNQLEGKVAEVEATSNDLENLLTSTNVPTLFLDSHLYIRRFTPTATRLFKLIPSDIGRPLSDIAQRFVDAELLSDAGAVLDKFVPLQKEIETDDGSWFMRQILPYRTADNRIEGVVVTFSDVAAQAVQAARLYAESIVDTVREPLLVLHGDLRVRSANRSFYEFFQTSPAETENQPFHELADERWNVPQLRRLLTELLPEKKVIRDFEVECDLPSRGRRALLLNAQALRGRDGSSDLILLAFEDITDRLRSQEALRATNEALRGTALFEGAPTGIVIVDVGGRILSVNTRMERLFGYEPEELIGESMEILVPAQFRDAHVRDRASFAADPRTRQMGRGRDLTAVRKDGTDFPVEIGLGPVRTEGGLLIVAHVSDISARKQAEEALQRAHEDLEHRVQERTAELRATNERLSELSGRMLTVQDEERRRIGRDLHDTTAQNLAGVGMDLTLIQQSAKRLSVPAQKALAESIALVDQSSREVRTFSYLLHPPLLDEAGLVSALRWYADGFAKRSGITVDVDVSPELGRLAQDIETALFRVVQECLTNVHRHANSSTVRIQITRVPNAITLKVEDTGRGIAGQTLQALADGDAHIGVGIMGMRERMRQLGGRLHISSTTGGTIVEATVPMVEPSPPLPG